MLGGSGTVNEVVQGLYYASQARTEQSAMGSFGASHPSESEPLSMPIGVIPEGSEVRVCRRLTAGMRLSVGGHCNLLSSCLHSQNVLYATIAGHGTEVGASEEETVRAMLRVARMRRAPLPVLLCQADDGVVMPALSNGAHILSAPSGLGVCSW